MFHQTQQLQHLHNHTWEGILPTLLVSPLLLPAVKLLRIKLYKERNFESFDYTIYWFRWLSCYTQFVWLEVEIKKSTLLHCAIPWYKYTKLNYQAPEWNFTQTTRVQSVNDLEKNAVLPVYKSCGYLSCDNRKQVLTYYPTRPTCFRTF